jgi:hypothetical protein
MKEIEIKSVHDIHEQVKRLQRKKTYSEKLVWRGQPDYEYNIWPKLHREKSWLNNEFHMIEELKRRKPESFKHCKSRFEELSICQHYGLPTRLLDVTENPLIALYFACKNKKKEEEDKDGEIIPFKDIPLNYWDTRVKCICFFSEILTKEILIDSFYDELKVKHNILPNNYTNDLITASIKNQASIIYPMINNDRLMMQHGAFLIFSAVIDKKNKYFTKKQSNINDDLYNRNEVRFIIPSEHKKKILKELEFYGIINAKLFPEIEYQCTDIQNYYS